LLFIKEIENKNDEFSYTCLINKNFQDFVVLSDLLCNYIPSLRSHFNELNRKSQSQSYYERNSKIFLKVLDGILGTNYPKISVGKIILGNIYGIIINYYKTLFNLIININKY